VGGQTGFGPVPAGADEPGSPPFHADWEARVYALAGVLGRRGLFTDDELRDANRDRAHADADRQDPDNSKKRAAAGEAP